MAKTAVLLLPFLILGSIAVEPITSLGLAQGVPASLYGGMGASLTVANKTVLEDQKPLRGDGQAKIIESKITAYSSSVDETDDTPFITASGNYVQDGVAAANFLPFGTRFRIPKLFGDKVFVIEDRMHKSYNDRIDLWFPSKEEALKFGYRVAEVEIL